MTREEFAELLTRAANPDSAPIALSEIRDGVGGLFATLDENTATIDNQTRQIGELRDTNMRLFLRIGSDGAPQGDDDHEESVDELNERMRKAARGEE